MKGAISKISLWLIWLAIVAASFKSNKISSRETNVINWDVYGYYLYLPALLNYHDTKEYRFSNYHFEHYKVSSNFYQLNELNDSIKAPIYTIGMALIYAPFYIAADLFCRIPSFYLRDSLSFPYQFAIVVASWIYALLGLYFLRKFLLRHFGDAVVAITLSGICFGTNYFHFAAFASGMPHAYLFSLYALLLYSIDRWNDKATTGVSLLIGGLIALACIARPSELVIIIYFLAFGIHSKDTLKAKMDWFISNRFYLLLMIAASLAIISIQIIYWKVNMGRWYYNGYAEHHFDFLKPHLIDGFFSYRKGWLVYSPLISFSIAGLVFLNGRLKKFRLAMVSFFIINCYVVFSWHIWWYASSFGARGVIQSYALLSIPFAAFIQFALSKPVLKILLIPVMLFFIFLNHFQDWQYRAKILPFDETTRSYYWKVFGKTHLSEKHIRKYMDVNEVLPKGEYRSQIIGELNFENDSLSEVKAGKSALQIAEKEGFSPSIEIKIDAATLERLNNKWLRIEAEVLQQGDGFGQWNTAYLCFSVERDEKSLKWVGLRFQQFLAQGVWGNLAYESQLPEILPGDVVKVYVWNQAPDKIWVYSLNLSLLLPQ